MNREWDKDNTKEEGEGPQQKTMEVWSVHVHACVGVS